MTGLNARAARASGRSAGLGSGGCTPARPTLATDAVVSGRFGTTRADSTGTISRTRRGKRYHDDDDEYDDDRDRDREPRRERRHRKRFPSYPPGYEPPLINGQNRVSSIIESKALR